MFDFPSPLRLAVGSHATGSGKGCAMNVISWENGDTTITDMPACADPMLARIVQRVNDSICAHRDGDLLCPDCSVKVLELAHRTVGTGGPADLDRRRVWVRVAADQARQVLHLAPDQQRAEAAIVAAERWADDPSEENRKAAATAATATAAAYATATAATAAYATAAYAAAAYATATAATYAAAAYATNAYATDAYATDAAAVGVGGDRRLEVAHRAIDTFLALTGLTEHTPDPQRTAQAVAAMTAR